MKKCRKNVLRVLMAVFTFVMVFSFANIGKVEAQAKQKKKVVVLYFSATGTTKGAAKKIQKKTRGKLIEIKAKKRYTEKDLDYSNNNSRVSREHRSASTPAKSKVRPQISNLKTIKKEVKKADVVYIGFAGGIIGLN